ncbi:corrinoid protein [candidate division WOR-3 bacterium]|nr:corrinoid protein [candidate division WOR-3 bacterium]
MDDKKVGDLVQKALQEKRDPNEILERGLIPGMKEVAALFACKEYFVPEVLLASESFYAGFNLIIPLIRATGRKPKAKVLMGVVEGDIHDIGKNIVKVLLESTGYEVIDLGKDIPSAGFIDAVVREKPGILALSSLMTTTMPRMAETITMLERRGLRERIKVMVGGAPVNEAFALSIGADGYSPDAPSAVQLADRLTDGHDAR